MRDEHLDTIPATESDEFIKFSIENLIPNPSIEEDDYDSKRDMFIFEELLSTDSLSLSENESFHFDIPSFLRPSAKSPDDDSEILIVKVLDDISKLSSSKLTRDQTSNPASSTNTTPKGRTRRSSKQKVENSNFEEHLPPVATMTNNRTMAEMLRAPTEGCAEAIVVHPILAEQFELKYSLINMMTSEQFFRLEKDNPHDNNR
nr:reverse transcriptase domain-containing protein [Tanacetum cinerariifolium]